MLLFVDRATDEKNVEFPLRALERALAHIPDLLLTIAGGRPGAARTSVRRRPRLCRRVERRRPG
jgi:hypothetical protein